MRPDHPTDPSKILFLDIETVPAVYHFGELDEHAAKLFSDKTRYEQERNGRSAEEIYAERGGILAEFGKIVCIGVGALKKEANGHALRVTSFHGDDERDVLQRFTDLLNKSYNTDDHWLCGHNGKEFDFPWIARRCVVHGIKLPRLLDVGGLKPWQVGFIDTMQLWSFGDRKNFTSLALLTHILGISTPKDDISGADVARVYYEEKDVERIATYCRKDVVATVQLYLRLRGIPAVDAGNITVV
ncbi:MAG: 3'-5' exonuclease [Flavobacteriales bacterium]|nr:3'-5' exonuclease [Flavobacteriales bacterium]MCL4282343.1 3'-5' exonuclease [Flavobacteriales bacterium]